MGTMRNFFFKVKQVFLLRKGRMFNKSRYARNRQTTRVAFYLSLLINILVIFAIFVMYYKFLFKFTYLWFFFLCFFGSFLLPAALRTLSISSFKSVYTFFTTLFTGFTHVVVPLYGSLGSRFYCLVNGGTFSNVCWNYLIRLFSYIYSFFGLDALYYHMRVNNSRQVSKIIINYVNMLLWSIDLLLIFEFILLIFVSYVFSLYFLPNFFYFLLVI